MTFQSLWLNASRCLMHVLITTGKFVKTTINVQIFCSELDLFCKMLLVSYPKRLLVWRVSFKSYCCVTHIIFLLLVSNNVSHDMTKPTKWLCAQRRLRSAWASTQSDQSFRFALNGQLRNQAFFMRTVKTLIRLGGCPGWSESSLGAHSLCWFCHVTAHVAVYSSGTYIFYISSVLHKL